MKKLSECEKGYRRWISPSNKPVKSKQPPKPDPFEWQMAWRKYRPPEWNLVDQQYFQAGWDAAIKHKEDRNE